MARSLLERFNEKCDYDPELGCVTWRSGKNEQGYGLIHKKNSMKKAHRVSYELFKGEIPEGIQVQHTCNNGHLGCVDYRHLILGTNQENVDYMVKCGRARGARGIKHHRAKITEKEVLEIRSIKTLTARMIGELYNISKNQVKSIRNMRYWKYV